MTETEFGQLHSKLICEVQCVENELKLIYSVLKTGNFEENYDDLEHANLGLITQRLKQVDCSDGVWDLSLEDYRTVDRIRELRNYWCHQCYLDFVYIKNVNLREERFAQVTQRLIRDEQSTWNLLKKLKHIRSEKINESNQK